METVLSEEELQEIVIDLDAPLNEFSELMLMGAKVKYMLSAMFNDAPINALVRGSRSKVRSFGKALNGEKRYMDSYIKYGLNDARTYRDKIKLNQSVNGFEKTTGLKWPIG